MKYFDPEVMGSMYAELAAQSDALLQGRRTYQVSAAAWPSRSGDPFTDWINSGADNNSVTLKFLKTASTASTSSYADDFELVAQ